MDERRVDEFFGAGAREKAKEGIEAHRKGRFTLTLSADGKPLKNVAVRVKQKKHEFRFGANIFMLDEIPDKGKNEAYKDRFANLFNMATLPFYWDDLEPQQGKPRYAADSPKIYRRPAPDLCLEFCRRHDIEPREHALCYDHFFPDWLVGKSLYECRLLLEKRMREISERYADKIPTIEVTNETEWREGKTALYEDPDFVQWCFKTAEKYFPSNKLCINEHTECIWDRNSRTSDRYYLQIENALLKGARIDAVGLQYHIFYRQEQYYPRTRWQFNPDHLYATLDLYSRFNLPIQITEVTIPAYTASPEDEKMQATMIENLYSLWFSHPSVEQIIYWNLADGYAAFTTPGNMSEGENYFRGGLLGYDMSEKPAYKTLERLIKKEWTTDVSAVTDENGCVEIKAFYGDYEIEAGGVVTSVNLGRASGRTRTIKL